MKTSIIIDSHNLAQAMKALGILPDYNQIRSNVTALVDVENHEINNVIVILHEPKEPSERFGGFVTWLRLNGFRPVIVPPNSAKVAFVAEMMKEAYSDVEQIALVSGASVYAYAVRILVANGKRIVVLGAEGTTSTDLSMEASKTITFNKEIND